MDVNCADLDGLVDACLGCRLPLELLQPLYAHLAVCDDCRNYVATYRKVVSLLHEERKIRRTARQRGIQQHERFG